MAESSYEASGSEIVSSESEISLESSVESLSLSSEGDAYLSEHEEGESDGASAVAKGKSKSAGKQRPQSSGSSSNRARRKGRAVLGKDDMEDLASWIFSTEQARKVEEGIRGQLLNSPRVNSLPKRTEFAKHLMSEDQRENFQLLIVGFCRKFSSLAQESYSLPPNERKANFSVLWMKVLTNFQPRRSSQERAIVERFLGERAFDPEVVHDVLSVLHEMVYFAIYSNIQDRKSATTSEKYPPLPAVETEETLYRYGGFALHKMIKLRKETLEQKGRMKASAKRQSSLKVELSLLDVLKMKNKSNIPQHLKHLDEGNLTFPRVELLPFIRDVDFQVREFANDLNFQRYPTKFIDMCQTAVTNNENLEVDFRLVVASLTDGKVATDAMVVSSIFKDFVSKIANVRLNEIKCAKEEMELKKEGKVVAADEMLRPKLKTYSIASKRK